MKEHYASLFLKVTLTEWTSTSWKGSLNSIRFDSCHCSFFFFFFFRASSAVQEIGEVK